MKLANEDLQRINAEQAKQIYERDSIIEQLKNTIAQLQKEVAKLTDEVHRMKVRKLF